MVSLAFHSSSPSRSRILPQPRPSLAQRIGGTFESLLAEWRMRRAIKSVEAMEPHLLRDIGIMPGAIEHAVRHGR